MGAASTMRDDSERVTLRDIVKQVLEATTIEDAREAYAAIRLARPGGLDRAESQDVSTEPTMTLVEVMRLAAHRDTIASEYASGFDVTFGSPCRHSSGRAATACRGTMRLWRRS